MNPGEIGNAIQKRRKQLHLTQHQLAEMASCSVPSIVAAEAGKETLRLNLLITILSVLGLDLRIADETKSA